MSRILQAYMLAFFSSSVSIAPASYGHFLDGAWLLNPHSSIETRVATLKPISFRRSLGYSLSHWVVRKEFELFPCTPFPNTKPAVAIAWINLPYMAMI